MHENNQNNYAFGSFLLNTQDRVLLHFDQPVSLTGKDFELLAFLVEHPNEFLTVPRLVEGVWGSNRPAHQATITHHIARIRKALGSDARNDKYIRTIHGKHGYRFVAAVTSAPYVPDTHVVKSPDSDRQTFDIDSHVFVPAYLGPKTYPKLSAPEKTSARITYKELKIETGRLCVLKSGIGLWHLEKELSFHSLVEIAAWRKELYSRIFQQGWLQALAEGIVGKTGSEKERANLNPILGRPGYAYSVLLLKNPHWKDLNKIRRVLQILACPKPLETKNASTAEAERVRFLERQLLEDGLDNMDMREFGLAGEDVGFASWEGVALIQNDTTTKTSINAIIELQIAMHSLWWLSKCMTEVWLSNPDFATREFGKYLPDLKRQYLILKNIGAKESTSQRTMIESVLSVNRLAEIVNETLELYAT